MKLKSIILCVCLGTTTIANAQLSVNKFQAEEGSKIILKNNCVVNYCPNNNFTVPLGAELEIIHGVIN